MAQHGWGQSFHAAHLLVLTVFLMFWRYKSRAGLFSRWRAVVRPIAGEACVFMSQWWAILYLVLTIELVLTSFNAVNVMQAAETQSGHKRWLTQMSMGVLPACVITYALSGAAMLRHLVTAYKDAARGTPWQQNLRWVLQYSRDIAVQVLFMPMVYHLMMCRVVLHLWAAVTDAHMTDVDKIDASDEVKDAMEATLANASASFAEMYDAYALYCFGDLGMLVAEHELGRTRLVAPDQPAIPRSDSDTDRTELLMPLLRTTLLFGVRCYTFTSILSAIYSIGLAYLNIVWDPSLCVEVTGSVLVSTTTATTTMALPLQVNMSAMLETAMDRGLRTPEDASGTHSFAEAWCIFKSIMYGANFATSTIAIYNLFSFEHLLQRPLKKFNPGLKFWSMKIPVSLAFSEIIILKLIQPFTGLTNEEVDIFDAVSKAYFMMLVAVLNVCAWRPAEEWYYWEEVQDIQYQYHAVSPVGEDGGDSVDESEDCDPATFDDVSTTAARDARDMPTLKSFGRGSTSSPMSATNTGRSDRST